MNQELAVNVMDIDIYTYEFGSDKELKKFINSCKKTIRGSYEYSEWVKYIKFTKQYSFCQFTNENAYELTVDIHHHPYSLESLVKVAIETLMTKYQRLHSFQVAEFVMNLHYQNKVGYVLLIKSLHEKFHNGYLKIPIDIVSGDWKRIEEECIVPDDVKEIVSSYKMTTIKDVPKLEWNAEYVIYDDGEIKNECG